MKKLAAVVLALALLGACSSGGSDDKAADKSTTAPAGDSGSTTTERPKPAAYTGATEGFYATPDPLPSGRHGDLVRYQVVKDDAKSTMYRIMYLSKSVAGEPIVVTGTAVVPKAPAPDGGRRLVALAHGTTGIADECAPSKDAGGAEMALAGPLADLNYLVAESDYEGLGTPGRHPYLVGESEGRGVIDGILAAKQLPAADGGNRLAIAGYSQGGHGALWANQVAGKWAPDLHVVGTFAGAPATEIGVILGAAPQLPIVAGFAYMILAGYQAAYGDKADPSQVLTPKGVSELGTVDQGCGGQIITHFGGEKGLVKQQPLPQSWVELADENNPGGVKTADPVLIIHSQQDNIVPVGLSAVLFARMCKAGQVVERRVLPNGGGHIQAAPEAYRQGLTWLADRFAGKPAKSTCPSAGGDASTTTTVAAATAG